MYMYNYAAPIHVCMYKEGPPMETDLYNVTYSLYFSYLYSMYISIDVTDWSIGIPQSYYS